MKVIAGLGNPGNEYAQTPHNAGFDAVDFLCNTLGCSLSKEKRFKAEVGKTTIGTEAVLLVKPQTYMNLSGEALSVILNYYKLKATDLIVLCDDVNLPPARLRLRVDGSHGGHNGLRSIIEQLGTANFTRVRIGVGRGEHQEGELIGHVLGKYSKERAELMAEACKRAAKAAARIVEAGIAVAMNVFNAAPVQKQDSEAK
jgi:PTH1 family peptidyl-tRNA hydrolase